MGDRPAGDSGRVSVEVVAAVMVVVVVLGMLISSALPERVACTLRGAATSVVGVDDVERECSTDSASVAPAAAKLSTGPSAGSGAGPAGSVLLYGADGDEGPVPAPGGVTPDATTTPCLPAVDSAAPSMICVTATDLSATPGVAQLSRCDATVDPARVSARSCTAVADDALAPYRPGDEAAWCRAAHHWPAATDGDRSRLGWVCASSVGDVYFCAEAVPDYVTDAPGVGSSWTPTVEDRLTPQTCEARRGGSDLLECPSVSYGTDAAVVRCAIPWIGDAESSGLPEQFVDCLWFARTGPHRGGREFLLQPTMCAVSSSTGVEVVQREAAIPGDGVDPGVVAAAGAAAAAVGAGAAAAAAAVDLGSGAAGAGAAEAGGAEAVNDGPTDVTDDPSQETSGEQDEATEDENGEETEDQTPEDSQELAIQEVSAGTWRCGPDWRTRSDVTCAFLPDSTDRPLDEVGPAVCAEGERWHASQQVCSPPSVMEICLAGEESAGASDGLCRRVPWPARVRGSQNPCPAGFTRTGGGGAAGDPSPTACRQRRGVDVQCAATAGLPAFVASMLLSTNPAGYFLHGSDGARLCATGSAPDADTGDQVVPSADDPGGQTLTCATAEERRRGLNSDSDSDADATPDGGVDWTDAGWSDGEAVEFPGSGTTLDETSFPLSWATVDPDVPGTTSPTRPSNWVDGVGEVLDPDRITSTRTPRWRTDQEHLFRGDGRGPLGVDAEDPGIFVEGFLPRRVDRTDLDDHVAVGGARGSAYVSTSRSKDVASAWGGRVSGWVYEVDPPGGIDINATFDRGEFAHFTYQHEVAFYGGIDNFRVLAASRASLEPGPLGGAPMVIRSRVMKNPCVL